MYDPLVVDRFIEIVRRSASVVSEPVGEAPSAAVELTKAIAANALARRSHRVPPSIVLSLKTYFGFVDRFRVTFSGIV